MGKYLRWSTRGCRKRKKKCFTSFDDRPLPLPPLDQLHRHRHRHQEKRMEFDVRVGSIGEPMRMGGSDSIEERSFKIHHLMRRWTMTMKKTIQISHRSSPSHRANPSTLPLPHKQPNPNPHKTPLKITSHSSSLLPHYPLD